MRTARLRPYLPLPIFGVVLGVLAILLWQSWTNAAADTATRRAGTERATALDAIHLAFLQGALDRALYGVSRHESDIADSAAARASVRRLLDDLTPPGDPFLEQASRIDRLKADATALGQMRQDDEPDAILAELRAPAVVQLTDTFMASLTEAIEGEREIVSVLDARASAGRRSYYRLIATFAATVLAMFATLAWLARATAVNRTRKGMLAEVRAERDRANLLGEELRHRLQNVFAIVGAIVTQTGRTENDVATATAKMRERINAIDRAQTATLRDGPGVTDPADIARVVCGPYATSDHRLTVEGDYLTTDTRLAASLGLILNELATNALKYGAWSTTDGHIAIEVRPAPEGGFEMDWTETGGPPPAISGGKGPERTGFGSRLAEGLVAQHCGSIDHDWRAEGLRVRLHMRPDGGN